MSLTSLAIRLPKLLFIALVSLTLAACQTYNTTSDGKVNDLMLQGHDPVAFFTEGRAVKGKDSLAAKHEVGTYYFANEANRTAFAAAPAKYAPQYGGFCTDGAAYDMKAGGEVSTFKVYKDKLYIFGGRGAYEAWALNADLNIQRADSYWKDGLKDANAKLSFYKRLIFRVPHYKSGAALAEEVAARRKAGTFPALAGAGEQ